MGKAVAFTARVEVLVPGPTKHALLLQYCESVPQKVDIFQIIFIKLEIFTGLPGHEGACPWLSHPARPQRQPHGILQVEMEGVSRFSEGKGEARKGPRLQTTSTNPLARDTKVNIGCK